MTHDILRHRSKLHLRVRTLGGQQLRILTPRPGTDLLLSNNLFHDTWHLLSDLRGARQLAQLAWFLAYQRHPGTVVLLDTPFVVSSPFDGDRARPVLLVPRDLTGLGHKALVALGRGLGTLGPPDCSVRIDTRGLEEAADADRYDPRTRHERRAAIETMSMRDGFVEYRADRVSLRLFAQLCRRIEEISPLYGSYHYLADDDGELQLFSNFRERSSSASRVREQLGITPGFATPEQQPVLWDATERALGHRRKPARASA